MASRKSLFFFFSLGHFANDFAPCSVVILAPAIALEMGLTPFEVGLLITLHSVGSSLGFFPAGLLADSARDRGNILMYTFWWVGIGYLLASWAPGFWSLALLFALAGSGDAAWHPLATTILVQNEPSRRAQALGIHAFGGTLSAVFGPVIVGILLAQMDWRNTLQWILIPTLLVGIIFLWVRNLVPEQTPRLVLSRMGFEEMWELWGQKQGFMIIALIITYHMSLMSLMSMIPLYLQEFHGLSTIQTGFAFGLMVLTGALLQPMMGLISDRFGRRKVIVLGTTAAVFSTASVPFFEQGEVLGAILTALLIGVSMLECIRPSMLAAAVEHSLTREGTTLGFAFSLMDGVGALGAMLAGWVAGIHFSHAFLLASVLSAITLILGLSVSLHAPNPAARP